MSQKNTLNSNRSGKFFKDVGLYAIGNIGSKLITFLMVPLYTYFVNTSEYGLYDICLTLIFFAIPFMTLQLRDGAFRFLVDDESEDNKKAVVTFAYRVMITTSLLVVFAALVVSAFTAVSYLWLMVLLLIVMSFYEVVVQITRGLGNTLSFVASGIISSLGIGAFSVLFVVYLKMGLEGIFLANILARFFALLFIELKDKIIKRYFVRKPDYGNIRRDMVKYSLPLIPGLVLWWIIGSTDRLFIEHYLGLSVNGMYAVAYRLVSILQVVSTIFYQAWQETALRQYESSDRDEFFSKMFNNYFYAFSGMLIIFVFVLKINYGWLVGGEFFNSVIYLYPMAVSVLLFALVAFMDMGYQCAKDTKRTLPAVICAAVVNICSNYILIKYIGLWGVVLTGILTYLVLLLCRIHDMKRYFKLSIYKRSLLPFVMLLIGFYWYYNVTYLWLDMIFVLSSLIIFISFIPNEIKNVLLSKLKRKVD